MSRTWIATVQTWIGGADQGVAFCGQYKAATGGSLLDRSDDRAARQRRIRAVVVTHKILRRVPIAERNSSCVGSSTCFPT